MFTASQQRLQDLETRFVELEHKLSDTPEKEGLPVGSQAPDFSLPDASENLIRLSDYRGQHVVTVFYPLDWSLACSDQLSLYQSELAEFERANASWLESRWTVSTMPPIVVYGTSWCAAQQVRWWTGGSVSHPTLQIGGQILVEPSLDELGWALSRMGVR